MIPEAAVEAALSALFPDKAISDFTRAVQEPSIRTILEAATPYMLTEAWKAGVIAGAKMQIKHDEGEKRAVVLNPYEVAK